MPHDAQRYRFLLIQPYSLPEGSKLQMRPAAGPKETALMNHANIAHLLEGVDWDLHPGPLAPHGDGGVEMREEFALAGVARLPIVREACASGRYNAIVLLGGGDPGFVEAREIGRRYRIPVTACAHAQMHVATMLGNKFGMIDVSEPHNMSMYDLVVRYRFTDKCAAICNIDFPLPRPGFSDGHPVREEAAKAARGESSGMLETTVTAAVAAIEEDGAEVIIFGCSAAYWMQLPLQQRLHDLGWEVPVLEGYGCAIAQAKLLVDLGVDASGLAFPVDRPRRSRRKKVF
ncbi:MAG TPA: aspartate/glutamate racemase family protein [Acetobacteraceae bacterium]|nr:aspartate/glutamate racemase family protein [Acetobacteraceae bacterium]